MKTFIVFLPPDLFFLHFFSGLLKFVNAYTYGEPKIDHQRNIYTHIYIYMLNVFNFILYGLWLF